MSNDQTFTSALASRAPDAPALRPTETTTAALAAEARAEVEARFVIAMRNPRNMDDVRTGLLHECKRPGFAASARYFLPIGKGVSGFSIRFAEAAITKLGNLAVHCQVIYEDDEKRTVRVALVDLERNVTLASDETIEKTIERRRLKDGETAIRMRQNAAGEMLYILPATERDLRQKQNAAISKALRTHVLRMLPGDIKEECWDQLEATTQSAVAADPDAARKQIVDAYAGIGVRAADLRTYLGHDLDGASPAEIAELRAVFVTVRDGEATWPQCLAAKTGVESDGKPDPNAAVKDKIAARLAAQRAKPKRSKNGGAKSAAAPPTPESNAPATREPGDDSDEAAANAEGGAA